MEIKIFSVSKSNMSDIQSLIWIKCIRDPLNINDTTKYIDVTNNITKFEITKNITDSNWNKTTKASLRTQYFLDCVITHYYRSTQAVK